MESERIKGLRLGLGLSQERFAQLLNVSFQTVRRWEGGIARPLPIISLRLQELQNQLSKAQSQRGGVPVTERGGGRGQAMEFNLGGLFKGIGDFLDLVSKMAEEGREEHSGAGETTALGGKLKSVYGFTVRMGLGGKPLIERFGNVVATEEGAVVAEVREPLVDVLDEGEQVVVIVELPGVEGDDIHLEVRGDILELTADTKDRKYRKELLLPCPVETKPVAFSYRNGILEVKLGKVPRPLP